ncbi:sodium-coupled monocarboxylate transporter 2 [Anabrus simplex]|uniref:sodium-coupled monocarboxylate transporter 2 n=1 Tax=Anabrus simplex TaxID=316456 RepID=UPI0035A2D198
MTINATLEGLLATGSIHFGWLDYTVFALMLVVSVVVGTWFGVCGKKDNIAAVDYLMGGKSMNIFPVGVSLAASHISGITLMGAPADLYMYGIHYMLVFLAAISMGVMINYIYLPVFYCLQLTSTYEYLEMRFNASARRMASFLFTLSLIFFLPICMYVPSLAFSQVSGVSLHLISPVVCFVCIFYTMMGGLKAVVWTDFLQAFVMVGSLIAVTILGTINVGGLGSIWEKNLESGRLDVSFNPTPFTRNTFWTVTVGASFGWVSGTAVNQGTMQKFLSLPTIGNARRALILFCVGVILLKLLSCFSGFIMYAAYYDCDPVKTQAIKRYDQLLPHFVMDTAQDIPGLPGLFIAGVFSAALSSMSSALNSLAGTIFEDFVSPCLSGKMSDEKVNMIMKAIVAVIGALCVALIFVVERLGSVLELGYSMGGITSGALLGLFSLGILFPWANVKGALAGSISSMALLMWIVFGTQHNAALGRLKHPLMPMSVSGCGFNVTDTPTTPLPDVEHNNDDVFWLYRVSYMYYTLIGTCTVFIVGLAVSFATGPRRPEDLDSRLFAPFVKRWVEKRQQNIAMPTEKELLNMERTS